MKKKVIKQESSEIDTTELLQAMDELEKTEGIKKDILMESIEQALLNAYKRNYDSNDENIKIVMDKIDGRMKVYQEKTVVENVVDDKQEISIEDAKKINPTYTYGDKVDFEIMPKKFGRIAAQTAKQIITQKIREASRDVIFDEFDAKKGEIIVGQIQKIAGKTLIIDLGKIEGIMPKKEQVETEEYNAGDKIKACIISVEKGPKGSVQVVLSRSSSLFLKKLFEIEIPEIDDGVIEIKAISREAGARSKVAVFSPNPNIDPVGSCVGQKGIRIQNIINEINGEKIDVIEWNEDPSIFISAALLPAKVMAVDVKEEDKFAQVIVPDDQLSLAIGKGGQNAKLAARLTGWKIDIKSESQFREMLANAENQEDEEAEDNDEEYSADDEIENQEDENNAAEDGENYNSEN